MGKYLNLRPNIALGVIFAFLANTFGPMPLVQAQEFRLPAPGVMVPLSPGFNSPILKGIKVHPDNPFRFDFILDKGDSQLSNNALKDESTKLIKYFLASLTIPEKDLWVNLSPYEKNRIVPKSFGQTEMGRDLLAEDYMLKQITASLIYPEDAIGKKFWKRIYQEADKKFGTTNIPVNTFNKVWIVPDKAVVYENAKAGTAYVVESKLKVMLEQDYLALSHNVIPAKAGIQDTSALGAQIVREIVIPELTKEINEGKNFAQLRQVYNSLILATWYKKKIKDSILEQVYADKNKVAGIMSLRGSETTEAIYQQYLQAFKKGAYNYIKEETDPVTQEIMPKKYFSGGFSAAHLFGDGMDSAMVISSDPAMFSLIKKTSLVLVLSSLTLLTNPISALAQNKSAFIATPTVAVSVQKTDLSPFFQGIWSDYMAALANGNKDIDILSEGLVRQAGEYSPRLRGMMQQLITSAKQLSTSGVHQFTARWTAFNIEYLIPNGYYGELDLMKNWKYNRYYYDSVIYKLEGSENRQVNQQKVFTLYGRKTDRLVRKHFSPAQSFEGHRIVFINLDDVDTNAHKILGTVAGGPYLLATFDNEINIPLITTIERRVFSGMNADQIKEYLKHILRGYLFTHQARDMLKVDYKGGDRFGISDFYWNIKSPEMKKLIDEETVAMLGQFIATPKLETELIKMFSYVLAGKNDKPYYYGARWILNNLDGRPVENWTDWTDPNGLIDQIDRLLQINPVLLRTQIEKLIRDNWSDQLLEAIKKADSAMASKEKPMEDKDIKVGVVVERKWDGITGTINIVAQVRAPGSTNQAVPGVLLVGAGFHKGSETMTIAQLKEDFRLPQEDKSVSLEGGSGEEVIASRSWFPELWKQLKKIEKLKNPKAQAQTLPAKKQNWYILKLVRDLKLDGPQQKKQREKLFVYMCKFILGKEKKLELKDYLTLKRIINGLSEDTFGSKLGEPTGYIFNIEKGRPVRLERLKKILQHPILKNDPFAERLVNGEILTPAGWRKADSAMLADRELAPVTITGDKVKMFAFEGDRNPLHTDEEEAKKSLFKGLVSHGVLTTTMALNEVLKAYPEYDVDFIQEEVFWKPVYFGEQLIMSAKVLGTEKNSIAVQVTIKKEINGKSAIVGELKITLSPKNKKIPPLEEVSTEQRQHLEALTQAVTARKPKVIFDFSRPGPAMESEIVQDISLENIQSLQVLLGTNDRTFISQTTARKMMTRALAEIIPGHAIGKINNIRFGPLIKEGDKLNARLKIVRVEEFYKDDAPRHKVNVAVEIRNQNGEMVLDSDVVMVMIMNGTILYADAHRKYIGLKAGGAEQEFIKTLMTGLPKYGLVEAMTALEAAKKELKIIPDDDPTYWELLRPALDKIEKENHSAGGVHNAEQPEKKIDNAMLARRTLLGLLGATIASAALGPHRVLAGEASVQKTDLSAFFQGIWSDYMTALAKGDKNIDILAKDLIHQAKQYSPRLSEMMQQLIASAKEPSASDADKFTTRWTTFVLDYLIPNGYFGEVDLVKNLEYGRYYYNSVIYKLERSEKRRVNRHKVLTLYGRQIDHFNKRSFFEAQSLDGHRIVFINLDDVDTNVNEIVDTVAGRPYFLEMYNKKINIPLITSIERKVFSGMNKDKIRKYLERIIRGHEFTHQAQDMLKVNYKGGDRFGISDFYWSIKSPKMKKTIDEETVAMLSQFIVAPRLETELIRMFSYVLSGQPSPYYDGARWILNKLDGRPVEKWTNWMDDNGLMEQIDRLLKVNPVLIRKQIEKLIRDNWSEQLLEAITKADSAMLVPNNAASMSDKAFLKTIHELVVIGKNEKRYQFWYDQGHSTSLKDEFRIREIDVQGVTIPGREQVGLLIISKWGKDRYIDSKGNPRFVLISMVIYNQNDQEQGVFSKFLRALPEKTRLKGSNIFNPKTLSDMINEVLKQNSLSKIFSENKIADIKKYINRKDFETLIPSPCWDFLYDYQQAVTDAKKTRSGLHFKNLVEIFNVSLLGKIMQQAGFQNYNIIINDEEMSFISTKTGDQAMSVVSDSAMSSSDSKKRTLKIRTKVQRTIDQDKLYAILEVRKSTVAELEEETGISKTYIWSDLELPRFNPVRHNIIWEHEERFPKDVQSDREAILELLRKGQYTRPQLATKRERPIKQIELDVDALIKGKEYPEVMKNVKPGKLIRSKEDVKSTPGRLGALIGQGITSIKDLKKSTGLKRSIIENTIHRNSKLKVLRNAKMAEFKKPKEDMDIKEGVVVERKQDGIRGTIKIVAQVRDPASNQIVPGVIISGVDIPKGSLTITVAQLKEDFILIQNRKATDRMMAAASDAVIPVPMEFTHAQAVKYFDGMMTESQKPNNQAKGLIRMNINNGNVMMSIDHTNKIFHHQLIEAAQKDGYSPENRKREWISLDLGWDKNDKLDWIFLRPPSMKNPNEEYSLRMLQFLGLSREIVPSDFNNAQYRNDIQKELIMVYGLIQEAVLKKGIDPKEVEVVVPTMVMKYFKSSVTSLDKIADLKIDGNGSNGKDTAMNSITAISPEYYSHVINPIQDLLRRKQIHGQRDVIISISGLAGTGKTTMGAVLKDIALEGYGSNEIATIDTDDFIPTMHMDDSGIYRGKHGEMILPTDDVTGTFQSYKFKVRLDELIKQNKLVIVTGIHAELFLERVGTRSTVRILLDPSNELETRLRAIIRDGNDSKFLASGSYRALQKMLNKEPVYDLTLDVIPSMDNNDSVRIKEPAEFKFNTASLDDKQYGDLKEETSFLIHSPNAIASALSSLPISLEQIEGVPNFNILIKGVLPAIQYLFDQGNSEIYFTVKRYSNGVWIILNALQGDIPPYAKGWSRASPFLFSIQNSPEVIFLGKKYGYARTVDRQFHKKDIIDRKGAISIALGYSEIGTKQPERRMISQFDLEDSAMISNPQAANDLGGIDLTSDKALTVQNNGQGIKFHIDPAMLKQLQNAPGFTPVIINIQPMTDLRMFLGLSKTTQI